MDSYQISLVLQGELHKGLGDLAGKFIVLQSALSFFQGGFTEAGSVAEKFSTGLQTAVSAVFAYQAITQLRAKQEKSELLASSARRMRLSQKGMSIEAAGTLRGGAIGSLQKGYGKTMGRLSTATLGGATGAVALAGIVGKGFNDIASLFYNKSPKVAGALDLLTNAADKAANSLSQTDKAIVKRGITDLNYTSGMDTVLNSLLVLNPLRAGREGVSLSPGKKYEEQITTKPTVLAGGQTAEEFKSAQSSLFNLIYSKKRTGLDKGLEGKKLEEAQDKLLEETQLEVFRIFKAATTFSSISGLEELDLSKVFENTVVKDLIKKSDEVSKILEIQTSNIEFNKPLQIFKRTIENIIFQGAQDIEDASQDLQRRAKVISAITSSKSFATLGDSSKIAFEINSSLEQFNAEYNNKIKTFLNETQAALKDYLPELGIAQEKEEPIRKAFEAVGKATDQKGLAEALRDVVSQIQSAGVSLDNAKFQELKNKVISSTNAFSRLIKEQDNELAILQFNNQERILEAQAYDTYRNNLANFVDGIIESEKSLIKLRGEIERIDVDKETNIARRTSYAISSREALLIRQEEERKAFALKRPKELEANLQEKQIAAERDFFTKENIAELNRNTTALENLTSILAQDFIKKIDEAINFVNQSGYGLAGGAGGAVRGVPFPAGISNNQQLLDYYNNLKSAYSPLSTRSFNNQGGLQTGSEFVRQIVASIRQGNNLQTLQNEIQGFDLNQGAKDRLVEFARQVYESSQLQGATMDQTLETMEKRLKGELEINDLVNSYNGKLRDQLRSVVDSLNDPQTRGEFLLKQGVLTRGAKELSKRSEQEKRDYRSSFGYGFDEAMDKLRARTEDFRNQLGQEIPDLFSQNLAQGLNDAISGAKDLKTALTDAATAFFQEITRKNISNLADLATRGLGSLAQTGFGALGFASGGFIKGGSGTRDDVPAMLMGGEYVVKKSAVNKYGKGFFDAINSGRMRGYAAGGMVDPQTFPTQTGRGGFFTPGDYGQGAITGKNELLTFATQSFTGGQYDYMGGFGMGGATVSLEPESARLSAFGRENSPMFERVQQSKEEAFKVYLEGLQKEKEYAELLDQIAKNEKARKKQLQMAIISAVVSSALSYAGNKYFPQGSKEYSVLNNPGFRITRTTSQRPSQPMISGSGAASYLRVSNNTSALPLPTSTSGSSSTPILLPQRTAGGLISGGSNIRDDVPAMLTGGEFVLNNRATQRIGLQNLNRLNSGAPVSSEGSSPEMTQTLIAKLDELIQTTANSSKENVVVNVSTNEAGGQTTENPTGTERDLQKKIRQAVLDVIAQEKRLGGSLEKSR